MPAKIVLPARRRSNTPTTARPTVVDLFCGAGGFSLGMKHAGFRTLAAIDFDSKAVETIRVNLSDVPLILEEDLTKFGPEELDAMLGEPGESKPRVDVIVGGPPCQGFSTARQVDGANHGTRLKKDARRHLYRRFLAFVAYFQPSVFVMENVLGIKSAAGGEFFARVQAEARALGYRVHGEEIRAWQYGVPQKRVRQLIIGTRRELPVFAGKVYMPPTHGEGCNELPVTLWEAIGDLPPLQAGEGHYESSYDTRRRDAHLARFGGRFLRKVVAATRTTTLAGHVARPHSERDLRDFARLREGEHSAAALARGEVMEFPYDRETFKDRYTRQHRNELCSTIVAHLSKDGLMFVHPTQVRSLTPREAARLQSFPDWFQFPEQSTHSFRLIGNAVPPLVGKAVGQAIQRLLADTVRPKQRGISPYIPKDLNQALEWMRPLVNAEKTSLRDIPNSEFLRGWFALGFLHSHLHPDSATHNGSGTLRPRNSVPPEAKADSKLFTPTFRLSGWPVRLVPIAMEAQRRLRANLLMACDYYSSEAHKAGAEWIAKVGNTHVWH